MSTSTVILDYLKTISSFRTSALSSFQYSCIEDYVLKNGRASCSSDLTPEERDIVKQAALLSGCSFFPKMCFSNAQALILHDSTHQLTYVEGYTTCWIPIHHGWVEIHGKAIDLTLPFDLNTPKNGGLEDRVWGVIPPDREYFGAPFSFEDVLTYITETQEMGSLLDDWKRGFPYLRI